MVENNLIKIQLEKEIKSLFKYYLGLIDELHLGQEQHDILRKKVLDSSNDTIRELLMFLSYFDFQINSDRVNEAAKKQQTVFKKTYISQPIIV
jgi:hypothetical protein